MNDNSNLTLDKLRDAMRTVTNATTVWYGTSDTVTRGKVLVSTATTPPFVIVHPDDVSLLGPHARHLREYRPTHAELIAEIDARRKDLIEVYHPSHVDESRWVMRLYPHWGK